MNTETLKPQDDASAASAYVFSDEATREKIRRHLTDISDVITDSDIANVKVPGAEASEQ